MPVSTRFPTAAIVNGAGTFDSGTTALSNTQGTFPDYTASTWRYTIAALTLLSAGVGSSGFAAVGAQRTLPTQFTFILPDLNRTIWLSRRHMRRRALAILMEAEARRLESLRQDFEWDRQESGDA